MPHYARFQPTPTGAPPLEVTVRRAEPNDAEAVAQLNASRNATAVSEVLPIVRAGLITGRDNLWVAESDRIVGYGKVTFVDADRERRLGDCRGVATGYYLMGVVVDESVRRRGVGSALTTTRMRWIEAMGGKAAYFTVNARNRASQALHDPFGFDVGARDILFASLGPRPGETYLRYDALLTPDRPYKIGTDLPAEALADLRASIPGPLDSGLTKGPIPTAPPSWVASRWADGRLVGLIRVVSDDFEDATIVELMTRPEYDDVGPQLVRLARDRFRHCRRGEGLSAGAAQT